MMVEVNGKCKNIAYYDAATITDIKRFIVKAPG
jgi:hypothetical protein